MSVEEFEQMEHRLGWKHEYWGGAARLSTQETAIVAFQRPVAASGVSREKMGLAPSGNGENPGKSAVAKVPVPIFSQPLRDGEQLRPIRAEDERGLAELFIDAFDDAVEFAGCPDDAYRQDAQDSLASFFGKPTQRPYNARPLGLLDASFLIELGEQILAAVLVRSIRRGPIIEPVMVRPVHQRRGLATALLDASLQSLNACGVPVLYSQCHLGNAASLAWHEKNGFQEIPNYFAAAHRWRHFAWLADHFEHLQQPDRACEMRQSAQHWEAVVREFEASNDRWSSGLLD
jgi:GNAT superfamily N-acetyltransferase